MVCLPRDQVKRRKPRLQRDVSLPSARSAHRLPHVNGPVAVGGQIIEAVPPLPLPSAHLPFYWSAQALP